MGRSPWVDAYHLQMNLGSWFGDRWSTNARPPTRGLGGRSVSYGELSMVEMKEALRRHKTGDAQVIDRAGNRPGLPALTMACQSGLRAARMLIALATRATSFPVPIRRFFRCKVQSSNASPCHIRRRAI